MLFLGVISFAFVLGLARDSGTDIIHNYVKLLLAITVFFTATQVLRSATTVANVVRVLVAGGGLAAVVGLVLWRLPEPLATRLLLGSCAWSATRPIASCAMSRTTRRRASAPPAPPWTPTASAGCWS